MKSFVLEKNFRQKMWIHHGQSSVSQAATHWYARPKVYALRCVPLEHHRGSWEPEFKPHMEESPR